MASGAGVPVIHHLGRFVLADQATVNVGALAMRYALSVFEGVRAYRQAGGSVVPFMISAHLRRMRESLRLTGLPDPGIAAVPDIALDLIRRNRFTDDVYLRPSVHAVNIGDLNAAPESGLTVTASPMGRKRWLSEGLGMKATLSAMRKIPHDSFPAAAKCIGAYAPAFIAASLAKAAGFDVPLLLNRQGHICEAPTAAVMLVRDNVLVLPAPTDEVLPSVTAFVLAELARRDGIAVERSHLRPEDAWRADELLLCGTGLEIAPVASLDGRPIRGFPERPVTRRLTEAYFRLVRGEAPPLDEDRYHA